MWFTLTPHALESCYPLAGERRTEMSLITPVLAGLVGLVVGAAGARLGRAGLVGVMAIGWPCLCWVVTPVSSLEVSGQSMLFASASGLGLAGGALILSRRAEWPVALAILGLFINGVMAYEGVGELRQFDLEKRASVTINRFDALRDALCGAPAETLPADLSRVAERLSAFDRRPDPTKDGWGRPFSYDVRLTPPGARLALSTETQVLLPGMLPLVTPTGCP